MQLFGYKNGDIEMKNEDFIKLIKGTYDYEEGDSDEIIMDGYGTIELEDLKSLPPDITFKNGGDVYLDSLEVIDGYVYFENSGDVILSSLKSIEGHVSFENGRRKLGGVYLESMKTLPERIHFNNGGYIYLPRLESLPPGVKFVGRNFNYIKEMKQDIDLESLESIPEERVFDNTGDVNLPSITMEGISKGVRFQNKGKLILGKGGNSLAIEGIDFKRCVNSMIEDLKG